MASRSAVAVSSSSYLTRIRNFGLLSPVEEQALATSWRDRQDIDAAHRLVTSHLGLVVKIAKGYVGYPPAADLISEGNVGLMLAVRRFDRLAVCGCPLIRCGGSVPRSRTVHSAQLVFG